MSKEKNAAGEGVRKAVALRYSPLKYNAPVVSAAGRGWLADRIVALARENRIPVVENQSLAEALCRFRPGEEIPGELYEAVAAVYAFIMETDRRHGR